MRTTNKTQRCQDLSVPESSGKIDQGCHVKFCLVLNLFIFFKLPIDDGVFEMFNSIRQFVTAFECTTGIYSEPISNLIPLFGHIFFSF